MGPAVPLCRLPSALQYGSSRTRRPVPARATRSGGKVVPSKHWRIETAALALGEPVERTRQRVEDGELPVVTRKGERLVPSAEVLELRERLSRGSQLTAPKREAATEAHRRGPNVDGSAGHEPREFSAQTVSEAVDLACSELGVSRDELVYEVRDTGLLHVLGLGADPATIVVHIDASHAAAPPSGPSNADMPATSSDPEGSAPMGEPSAAGRERPVARYYSLGQAALVLQVPHPAVRAMASQGRLRAETINGYLWFPSRDFEDFVVREYGSGRLGRVSEPYAAERVRGPNPFYPGDRGAASGSVPPRDESREPAEASAATGRTAKDADRRAAPAAAGHNIRVIMEAAQRYGVSTTEIRRRVAAKQLLYDPGTRRLSEEPGPDAPGRRAAGAETKRAEIPDDPGSDGSSETKDPASGEYLHIPDVALELGESIVSVLGRIGKRELETKQIRGRVMVRRESVAALKERIGTVPPQPSTPAAPTVGQGRGRSSVGGPGSAKASQEQGQRAGGRVETKGLLDVRWPTTDERLESVQEELRKVRAELGAERARREDDKEAVKNLQRQLEESRSREGDTRERLSEVQRELVEVREKAEQQGSKRLLGGIRRMLSQ